MKQYVGLDVSLEETSLCVVNESGDVVFRGRVASTPEAIERAVRSKAPAAERVVLEAGPLSTWLWHELRAAGLPVVCADARHAKAALKMQVNKTDDNDAEGLARIAHSGWYREVRVKSLRSHFERSLLGARARLVKTRCDLDNQVRGLLKTFGLKVGRAGGRRFAARVRELSETVPMLAEVIEPLLAVRETVLIQTAALDKRLVAIVRDDERCRLLMTAPGVGAVTALAFAAAIDDPTRFKRSSSVGAYLGLTPRRHQSGQVDRAGRVSKCGDRMVRGLLYEAAGVLLTRVARWCPLKAWGMRLAKRIGARKAKVAVARKLAAILYRMAVDGTPFRWTAKEVSA